ncbi:C39 family peptidase [Candidatus Roizmanbacteria bacterium]|nr:C39 family peptidase [Candidatus Roizmanbacteria bacterium]
MKNIRFFFIIFLSFCLLLFIPTQVLASTIFQDNFETGTANQWTPILIYGPDLWQVRQVNGSYRYGAYIGGGSTIILSDAGNITTPNYTIEYDYLALSGEDKNFDFRWVNNLPLYEVHFTNGGALFVGNGSSIGTAFAPYTLQNGVQYHIKIILQGQHIQFFVNTDKIFDLTDVNYQFNGNEKMGLVIGTGSVFPTEAYFDNVVVTDNNISSDLNVPLLKQTSDPWQSFEYDSAHLWSPQNITVNRWGCALTSAAMILQYYGIEKLPDGTPLDPGTINTWLKGQSDGYIKEGWVNWVALSRLSKLARNINGITAFDSLEYKRSNGSNNQLASDINNLIPDILEVPGHFIVAKGINGSTFNINDPYYNRQTLNDGYSNTFSSLGRFIPSHTDLSYIMLVVNEDTSVKVLDGNGNEVGESFIQNSLVDPVTNEKNGSSIRMFYLSKPDSGNYTILASSSAGVSKISTYLYNIDGDVSMFDNLLLGNNSFTTNFDKNNLQNDQIKKIVTFDSVIKDIKTLDSNNEIDHKLATKLIKYIKDAKEEFGEEPKEILKEIKQAERILKAQHNKIRNTDAYQLLLFDFISLEELIGNNSKNDDD